MLLLVLTRFFFQFCGRFFFSSFPYFFPYFQLKKVWIIQEPPLVSDPGSAQSQSQNQISYRNEFKLNNNNNAYNRVRTISSLDGESFLFFYLISRFSFSISSIALLIFHLMNFDAFFTSPS